MDHLIVGQGLAGSLMAWHLMNRGRTVLVVDRDELETCSKVAAGLVTPIAGQQFSMSATIETDLPIAMKTYWDIEELCGKTLFHHLRIARLFKASEEKANWEKRIRHPDRQERYTNYHRELVCDGDQLHADHGGLEICKGGWLNVPAFLEAVRRILLEKLGYAIGRVDPVDLIIPEDGGVKWKNITAQNIIFCQGWQSSENPLFKAIPMNCARGDILDIESPGLQESRIMNRNGWVLPLGDGRFRGGSTYEHHYTSAEGTEAGKSVVEEKIAAIIKPEFKVLRHRSGIRPIIRRSQVFMGRHPQQPNVVFFNGLGSKGVSNGPAHTLALVEYLLDDKPLESSVDIRKQFTF